MAPFPAPVLVREMQQKGFGSLLAVARGTDGSEVVPVIYGEISPTLNRVPQQRLNMIQRISDTAAVGAWV